MDLWKGKVAVVTGASAGIGVAICKDLCQHGVIVVGLARRLDRMEALKQEIQEMKKDAKFFAVQCDLTSEDDIKTAFDYVQSKLGGVDILINNAGIVQLGFVLSSEDNLDRLRKIMDTNFISVVSCTKKAFKSMSDRDVAGYIINISSVAGHYVPNFPGLMNVYPSSKHAVAALVQVMRHELNYMKKNKIRVSNISPGGVKTEISASAGIKMDASKMPEHILEAEDVSDMVIHLLGSNPRVQVEDVIMRAAGE